MPFRNTTWKANYDPLCPDGMKNPSKSGFRSEEEAWDYVRTQICSLCIEELELGHGEVFEGDPPRIIDHPQKTGCGAEWSVIKVPVLI